MPKAQDLSGRRYGRLIVLGRAYDKPSTHGTRWECLCDCGKKTIVTRDHLISGGTRSCGCLHDEVSIQKCYDRAKHNMAGTRIYHLWAGMRARCENEKFKFYFRYGGRGIKVCDEWKDFVNFYEWAKSNGYRDDLSIDRIDNNGNYEPSNCRWITLSQQQRNRRSNRLVTYKGETRCLKEWCEILDMSYTAVHKRLKAGWTIEDALTIPTLKRGSHV